MAFPQKKTQPIPGLAAESPPEGYRVLDQNRQTWHGDGPYWIGAAARLGSCTLDREGMEGKACKVDKTLI